MGLILPNLRDLEFFNCADCREVSIKLLVTRALVQPNLTQVSDFTLKQLSEKKRLRHIM